MHEEREIIEGKLHAMDTMFADCIKNDIPKICYDALANMYDRDTVIQLMSKKCRLLDFEIFSEMIIARGLCKYHEELEPIEKALGIT